MEAFERLPGRQVFDCQLYVSKRGMLTVNMPQETGPVRVARLQPLKYDELIDPAFRKLLATFESIPQSRQFVQV